MFIPFLKRTTSSQSSYFLLLILCQFLIILLQNYFYSDQYFHCNLKFFIISVSSKHWGVFDSSSKNYSFLQYINFNTVFLSNYNNTATQNAEFFCFLQTQMLPKKLWWVIHPCYKSNLMDEICKYYSTINWRILR